MSATIRLFTHAIFPLLLLLLTTSVVRGSTLEPAAPELVLLIPFEGQILPNNEQVKITAVFDPPIDLAAATDVQVTIEAEHAGERIPIATGDLRTFSQRDRFEAVWDVSGLPVGPYRVRIEATAEGVRGEAEVTAHVHPTPQADLSLRYIKAVEEGVEVGFHVEARSPNNTPIPEYLWVPGDGSEGVLTDSPDFSYVYPYAGAIFNVGVEVRDALGGGFLIGRTLKLPAELPDGIHLLPKYGEKGIVFAPKDNGYGYPFHPIPELILFPQGDVCDCDEMVLTAKGSSSVYCITKPADGSEDRAISVIGSIGCMKIDGSPQGTCKPNQLAYKCPLGQVKPGKNQFKPGEKLGWGFEVFSRLGGLTNDEGQCTQGQYARGTAILDGDEANPVTNPKSEGFPKTPAGSNPKVSLLREISGSKFEFPVVANGKRTPQFSEGSFGADDFTTPGQGTVKHHTGQGAFYWWDAPGVKVKDPSVVSVANSDGFVTFVAGNNGLTCWCKFQIEQRWKQGTGVEDGANITVTDGNRCVAGPGVQKADKAGRGVIKRR